jgi:osmotically-inducible protein OsmY
MCRQGSIVNLMAQTQYGTDRDLQMSVVDLLNRMAGQIAHVGVSVRGGMVMLFGEVGSTAERLQTRRAAMGVLGVRGVADEMVVREPGTPGTSDADLTKLANRLLATDAEVPADGVRAGVRGCVLTLSGAVAVTGQRDAAARTVRNLPGIVGLCNDIRVARPPIDDDQRSS